MKNSVLLICFSGFFLSCSHIGTSGPRHQISHSLNPSPPAVPEGALAPASFYKPLPDEDHHKVDLWIRYFTGPGRELMQKYLERSTRYSSLMKAIIREQNLPEDLVYIALIESGFSFKAHSRSNAVGYWQFIKSTGRRYGLRIDHFVDERRDPVLSTRAAMEFFKDLYSLFDSWHLAMASYNAGEYRVNRAVLKHYNRDFWYLISRKSLPSETSNYVPKFIAARRIAKNPEKYGFPHLQYEGGLQYDTVPVPRSVSLKKLSERLDIDYDILKSLNPMYKGEYIPVYDEETAIRVPAGLKAKAVEGLQASFMVRPKYAYMDHYWYRVRRGDTLYRIARRNKTTVANLRRANKMGGRSLIRLGQKLKVPTRKLSAVRITASGTKSKKAKAAPAEHRVSRGDTLAGLSKTYGVSVASLKGWNNLRGATIHPGQVLQVKKPKRTAQTRSPGSANIHVVRRGETLIGIADQYKISLVKLMKANSLNFKSILLTGTRLNIPK